MSLLTIITGACNQLNVSPPTSVIAATDLQTKQLLAMSRTECRELMRRFDWQGLTKEATFVTVATEIQITLTTAVADFFRYINGSMWNRTRFWKVGGPLSDEEWQARKAAAAQVGVRNYFRIRRNNILFFPRAKAGDNIYFEYISNQWCQSAASMAQTDWIADTDTAFLDEEVIRLGVVWRFLKAKGLDYSEEFRTYETALNDIFAPDGGSQTIDMTGVSEYGDLEFVVGGVGSNVTDTVVAAIEAAAFDIAVGAYVVTTETMLLINKTIPAANTIQLPSSASRSGASIIIKDIAGNAATYVASIVPYGAETIDGLSTLAINSNYGGFNLVPIIGGWYISP